MLKLKSQIAILVLFLLSPILANAKVFFCRELLEGPGIRLEIGPSSSPICPDCIQVEKFINSIDFFIKNYGASAGFNNNAENLAPGEGLSVDPYYLSSRNNLLEYPGLTSEVKNYLSKTDDSDFPVNTFAPGTTGIIADAQALPYPDQSVSLIVMKNFSWLIGTGDLSPEMRSFIQRVLAEYFRLLKPSGQVVVLAGQYKMHESVRKVNPDFNELDQRVERNIENPDAALAELKLHFGYHMGVAQDLGFKVDMLQPFSGPILNDPDAIGVIGFVLTKPQ